MNSIELLKQNNVDVDKALELWGDIDSYNDSLKEYKDSLNTKLADLEKFKNNNDLENYSILVHSMKSEAKYLGFMKDSEVFLSHELESKNKNIDYVMNNFVYLRDTVFRIENLIKNYFGEDAKKKIIIADDSNIILSFLEKILDKTKYEIIKAKDGVEAISALSKNYIYAILLDLNMPGVNGFDVLNYLKDNKLIDVIPVIIITGDDTEETINKTFNYPILDVLNKPFNEKNIEKVLNSVKNFYDNRIS